MPVKHGPNEFSEKDAEEYGKALQKLSPETIGKCEKFLLEGEKSLCVVVVGESGSGKSTFINALLGEDVAPVDGGRSSVPRKPSFYSGCVTNPSSNVSLTIVEVPEMKVDEMRAQQANFDRYCREGVDVVYVCQKMYDRQNSSAIETFRRLRTVFDGEIYKKAVIVLTFANDFPSNWGDERDEIALQQKIEKVWSDQASAIRGQLQRELQITREEAEKVLILPAGFYVEGDPINSRKIPGVTSDWINDMLLASMNTSVSAAPAIIRIVASQATKARDGGGGSIGEAFIGYVKKFLQFASRFLNAVYVARSKLKMIVDLAVKVATAVFKGIEIAGMVGRGINAIYDSGAAAVGAAGGVFGGAIGGLAVSTLSGVVVGVVVGATIAGILILIYKHWRGLLIFFTTAVGTGTGATAGALAGAALGSAGLPLFGTVVGAGIGALVGIVLANMSSRT